MAGIFNKDIFNEAIFNTAISVGGGVQITGTHARPVLDLRGIGQHSARLEPQLICVRVDGKIRCHSNLITSGRILKSTLATVKAKISRLLETKVRAKIWKDSEILVKSHLNHFDRIRTTVFKVHNDFMLEKMKEAKNKRLKKLVEEYRHIDQDL